MTNEGGISNINFINFTDDEVASVSNDDVERPTQNVPTSASTSGFRLFNNTVDRRQIGIVFGIFVVAVFVSIGVGVALTSHPATTLQLTPENQNQNQSEIEIGGSYVLNGFDGRSQSAVALMNYILSVV
jgi:hypothetical protein